MSIYFFTSVPLYMVIRKAALFSKFREGKIEGDGEGALSAILRRTLIHITEKGDQRFCKMLKFKV